MIELPEEMSQLYRHFDRHVVDDTLPGRDITAIIGDEKLSRDLQWFMNERMSIWQKKWLHESAPYTENPVLQTYRFCNILRELDRQTMEYHALLNPLRDDVSLWLMNMFYARMVARPETVKTAGLLSFDEAENAAVYERLLRHPTPTYGTPYVFPISTIMKSATPTRELFVTCHLPRVMGIVADEIQTWQAESVLAGVGKILPLFGYNLSFLWTEVLIDVAYQYPERVDLFAPFPIGPGAAPTFARMGSNMDATERVHALGRARFPLPVTYKGKQIVASCENWEGIGCEFRKFTNLSAGKGRRRYFR